MTFSTVGTPPSWTLSDDQIAEWQESFPRLDVREECLKARAWTLANSKKTARGMNRFLVAWLCRASDRRHGPEDRRAYPMHERRAPWVCDHVTACSHREMCRIATELGRPIKVKESA